jgi:hypothetical protein
LKKIDFDLPYLPYQRRTTMKKSRLAVILLLLLALYIGQPQGMFLMGLAPEAVEAAPVSLRYRSGHAT